MTTRLLPEDHPEIESLVKGTFRIGIDDDNSLAKLIKEVEVHRG